LHKNILKNRKHGSKGRNVELVKDETSKEIGIGNLKAVMLMNLGRCQSTGN
jgi:hypothetical protein